MRPTVITVCILSFALSLAALKHIKGPAGTARRKRNGWDCRTDGTKIRDRRAQIGLGRAER